MTAGFSPGVPIWDCSHFYMDIVMQPDTVLYRWLSNDDPTISVTISNSKLFGEKIVGVKLWTRGEAGMTVALRQI